MAPQPARRDRRAADRQGMDRLSTAREWRVVAVRFVRRFPRFWRRELETLIMYDSVTYAEAVALCALLNRQDWTGQWYEPQRKESGGDGQQ